MENKRRKKPGEALTEALAPEDSVMEAAVMQDSEKQEPPSLSQRLQSGYDDYLKPLIDARVKAMDEQQQISDKENALLRDRLRMQQPDMQGPPQASNTLISPETIQRYSDMAAGSLGGGGQGVKKATNWMQNPKNIEAIEGLTKNTTEGVVGRINAALKEVKNPRQISEEGIKKAQAWFDAKLKDPNISKEERDKALGILKTYLHEAQIKGFKIPE